MPTKGLETADVLAALESKLAYLPGGRDHEGRPLIVVNVPPELQPTTKPRLESIILYFLSIFSEETRKGGLVLIVDARRRAWRVARSCIRLSVMLLGNRATSVFVVRPDGFWDKRVDSCTKSYKDSEPIYLTVERLHAFIEYSQLPYELCGSKFYDHTEWIQKRLRVEEYMKNGLELLSRISNLHERLSSLDGIRMRQSDDDLESYWEIGMELTAAASRILDSGRSLVNTMSRDSSKDSLDTVKRIHGLIDSIELKQVDIENCWTKMERSLDTVKVIDDLEKGVSQVTEWILGPADAMLNSNYQVGFDVVSSDELRRQHEQLELECRDTYGRYAELLHKIDRLPTGCLPEDLKSQKDFMDFVCRSFASRLERRRNVLITCQRFFRLVSEYFDKTSEVFDKLVMTNTTHDFSQASGKLLMLEKNQLALEALEQELVKEGEKLSDILSMPVKDALGRDVRVDYGEDIINVRDILDATTARKNIFNDSVELQKLTLKQISLIYTYENDAEQAVKWLNDLYNVLFENLMEVGCNASEIQSQKEEHQSFQETAKGTYEYGCQLVNGARVLRLSCRLPLDNNVHLFSRLRQAWKQLRSAGQEQLTRLRVCAVFHRSVEDHCSKLRDLIEIVGSLRRARKTEDLASECRARAEIRDILGDREKLLLDVGRMVRLGRLLRTRLKEPVCHQRMSEAEDASGKAANLTAVEAISAKLAEVTRLAEKLDAKLCEAGARTQPVPISTSALMISSSLTSTTTTIPRITSPVAHSRSTTTTTTASITAPISEINQTTLISSSDLTSTSTGADVSTLTSSSLSAPTFGLSGASVSHVEDTKTSSAISSIPSGSFPSTMASSEAVSNTSSTTDSGEEKKEIEDVEKLNDESAAEDVNVDGYVTATECSITPTARSRSESFVTSPECEGSATVSPVPPVAPAISSPTSAWWKPEVPTKEPEIIIPVKVERSDVKFVQSSSDLEEKRNGLVPIEKVVSIETSTEERSGKIVKEVTETTTLRVSHDTRLGVASYKVTSNTMQDHRQNVDVKEMHDLQRVLIEDSDKKVNGIDHDRIEADAVASSKAPSKPLQDESSTRTSTLDQDYCSKLSKEITTEETKSETKETRNVCLITKDYRRHHEDSGIEMSPTKRDKDDIEGEEFMENARKARVAKMVDGHDSMEMDKSPEGPDEDMQMVLQDKENVQQQDTNGSTPTTTISTIAVQSGETRLVIALLQSGEWLRLKVLEVQPELTKLGGTVKDATELSNAHNEVLLRLQSKQSPVEELLRQADQLISTQRPRAEVYAAMAETLGQAWRDVNDLLERRKQILDSNVLFQCRAEECRESMKALEMACNDTLLPIEIEAVKNFLSKIHDLRKTMLETLMGALQEGKTLLDKLKEIANEGTLDSRPDKIKIEADHAVLKVERWLEDLHDKRRLIEASFRSRKTQLEQCLALALLATDLRDLEEILNDRIAALSSSCDQLGDSSSSAELLLFELKKLQAEAKEFQDRSIKITKSTERLVSSGHFAGEQATEQAYAILGAAADYVNDLDQYEALLNRAVAFFEAARSAITKLDQLEIQLVTTEYPQFSTRLASFHAQTVSTIEDVTSKPLMEGYALLDVTGRGAPGAEGVKRTVEELENRKIRLLERCTAHEAENLEISRMISTFLEKHEELHTWLINIAEAFLQGHQDMGSDLPMAKDFYQLHSQLFNDLEKRTNEVEHLEFEILPIRERLDEVQWHELQKKVVDLQNSWARTKNIVARRIDLGFLYFQFHEVVDELRNRIESFENDLKSHSDVLDENRIEDLKKKWKALQPVYLKLSNSGKMFLDEAVKVDDPYLDIPRACLCVQTLLEKFSNRQLTITEYWEQWQTTIKIMRERRIEHERKIEESTRTLEWVSKFGEQLYPVITCQSSRVDSVLRDLEGSRRRIVPELNKAVDELDARIKSIDNLVEKGEMQVDRQISERLSEMHEKLHSTAKNYKDLLMSLISIFENLHEVEHKIDEFRIKVDNLTSFSKLYDLDIAVNDFETSKRTIMEFLKRIQTEIETVIVRIKQVEAPDAAVQDIEKLRQAVDSIVSPFQSFTMETLTRIEEHRRICIFGEDLSRIDSDLRDLSDQLQTVSTRFQENLQTAKAASAAFSQFEATMTMLEQRIDIFVRTAEETIATSVPHVRNDLASLKERWRDLKSRMEDTKKRMVLCIQYFELLEEAKEWYREGGKLLIVVARKATSVKVPKDATDLLQEIEAYLRPGEQNQENRIERLKELSTIIFGTDRLPQFNEVIVENRQMLDSFAVISSELRTLAQNLQNAEDLREKLRVEKLEADEKLHAVKREMAAAEAAREEAENARKIAEKLAAETLERAELEAQRLKEERLAKLEAEKVAAPPSFSVSAQTDKIESTDQKYIHETHTSAVTKKEIHILQKMEVEKIVPIIQREPSPPKKIVTEESFRPASREAVHEEERKVPPEFVLPLNDATVQEGEKFTFECRLIGYPIPEVVWYKDGISILNNPDYLTTFHQGICTLTIEETFAEDSAKFTCKAFNNLGSAETCATLTVKETAPEEQPSPPVFVKELQSSVAVEGSSYRLECTVEGNPLPTVQWYKNETNIDNSPDYVITYNNGEACLSFEEVFLDDRATYTCKATNRLGQASTSALLDVESMGASTEKPYFLTPLSNAMARAGQRVKLECEATGNPIPRLSWTHDGKTIEETIHTKIQTEGGRTSLIISEAFPKDAGCYTVIAKNDVGEASVSCNVSVKGRLPRETSDSELACSDMEPTEPKIKLRLKDHEIFEGRTVRLDCVIVGQPEPEVIWYHNDKPVKESADFQLLFQGDKCSLVIHEAFLDDAGIYKVVAINSGGEASSQCILKVIRTGDKQAAESTGTGLPPKFVKLPTDSLVAEGEDASFECAVTGEPKLEIKWYSDNNEIIENDRIMIKQKEDGTVALKILSAIPEDKGNYVVKATNPYGEAKAFARLVVRSLGDFRKKEEFVKMEEKLIPPSFKERFTDRLVPEGISTKFECIVIGKPAPKIQWLFNDRPVHGKDFLVSVSGDRQVLTIPETGSSHAGTISCVAENTAGKASCDAKLEIGTEPTREEGVERVLELLEVTPIENMHAASSSEKHFSSEKLAEGLGTGSQILTKMSETVTESTTTHKSTKKEFISSMMSSTTAPSGQEPTSVTVKTTMHSTEQSSSENGAPPVVQSHKIEEFEKIIQDQPGEIRQEKTVVVSQGEEGIKRDMKSAQVQKPSRKSTAPRFVSPLTGMIVDQGADVVLEGIVDGYPLPNISWSKNGQELQPKDGAKTSYAHNHVRLEMKNVNVKNAGRYTCTASNEVGSASSTADLVVKKTIFPPVFGRRLQAQVVKRGDRVIMEVEITGTPEPTVTWYKDDVPIKEQPPELRIRQQGNCYILQIDKATKSHAGKYMVRATNAGGEAQSIADFAVFEPTPDTMTEVHKTVIYENIQDKKYIQPDGKKVDVPSATLKTEQLATTTIQPSSILKTVPAPTPTLSTIRTTQILGEPETKTCRSETISSTFESHQTETKSEQKFHMKLEHKTPPIFELKARPEQTTTVKQIAQEEFSSKIIEPKPMTVEETTKIENENIETSTIARKDALSFFESITKESETVPKGPKEMIKLIDDVDGKGHEVKVGKLTQNYERSTTYQEVKKPEPKSTEFQTTKRTVQDMFTKLEHGSTSRGVDNKLFEFPYEEYKLPQLDTTSTILEDITASGSSIDTTLSISKLQAQSESAETMLKGFNLVPEPPPEIGYMPKPEEMKKKTPDVPLKAKQLQESFEKTLSPLDAPIGGVKIFPTTPIKVPESPKVTKKPFTMPPPPFELERKEVIEETCIKKDVHEKKDTKIFKVEKIEPPKFEAPKYEPPKFETPKYEPPKFEAPKYEPPKFEAPKYEPPKFEAPKFEAPKYEPPKFEPPKCEAPKYEPPKFVPTQTVRPASPPRPWSSSSDIETRSHVSTDISEYRCHSAASSHQEILRSTSPRPSADGLAMEKSWAKKCTDATRKSWPPPSESASTTHKQEWQLPGEDYKTSTKEFRHETEHTPEGGIKKTSIESSSTLEKHSWSSKQESMDKVVERAPSPPRVKPIIYKAETIKVDHAINTIQEKSMHEKYTSEYDIHKKEFSEKTIEEMSLKSPWSTDRDLKAPSLVKSVEPPKKPFIPSQETSKITESYSYDSVVLEPGPPPEIGYVPPPTIKEKKIEKIEKTLEMSLESQPAKIPPGAIRTIPPPFSQKKEEPPSPPVLPPKDVRITPPPVPAKQPSLQGLEPFPFKPAPSPTVTKPATKLLPPPTPTKFVKTTFGSDYESDIDIHLKPKWRPYESDSEEPRYRRVQAPVAKQTVRPRSTEPEPLPPSKFDVPPVEFTGTSKSMLSEETQQKMYKKTTYKRHERETKLQQQQLQQPKFQPSQPQTPPIILKPGSPPIYVQPTTKVQPPPKSPPAKKPESPKFKTKIFQQESGYMADTDEPLQQKASNVTIQKSFGKQEGSTSSSTSHMESRTSYSESKSEFFESKSYHSHQQQKKEMSSFAPVTPPSTSLPIQKPVVQQQRTSFVEKSYSSSSGTEPTKLKTAKETVYSTDLSSHRKMETTRKVQPPSPSPSKFVKGEFRESDYESDYDGRISSVWKPRSSDTDDRSFKPVKPTLTGSGKSKEPFVAATPPEKRIEETLSSFDQRRSMKEVEQESRIEDRSMVTPTKFKQVLLPGSPPEIAYAPPQGQETYYEARAGMPYHNAIGTETRKTVRMDESTENSRRIVTVEQTSRVIKFGDAQKTKTEPSPVDSMPTTQKQPKSYFRVPTPKKFVQGQFRESDYESDVDSSRIRPKWTPADSDSEDPRYRRVQPPSGKSLRSTSLPVRQEHVVSPMEFDSGPPAMKRQTSLTQFRDDVKASKQESQKFHRQTSLSRQDEQVLQPGSPPEFGFISRTDVKAANHVASRHMSDMTNTFKSKTEKFVSDIQSDLKQGKPILKHPAESRVSDSDEPRTYREESRVAEHGTKQIDPDTGLIYFKYDFGYEFGIVLPGEGKKTITSTNKTIQGQRRASDIDVPIVHEFTTKKENGYAKKGTTTSSSTRPNKSATKFGPSKTVKWEPTSESEFSEAEDTKNARRRHPGVAGSDTMPPPPSLVIPCSPSPFRWDHTTPSPLSLSPSLPSLSPRYSSATGPPSNVDSAGSPWPTSNGVSSTKEVIQPYLEILPKKAPLFITPLRDIAVVSGQTARFECIVQAEPQPNILWSKDGRIIENSSNYEIHYRNGVCRLTITHAFPDDAGTYACTATNGLGSTVTSATLQVPGNRRSIYAPI